MSNNEQLNPDQPWRQGSVTLSDGRQLKYAEFGDLNGAPLLHFHGAVSSRWEGVWLGDSAAALKIRVICPDRPGFGGSTFLPGRRFGDWPSDATQLMDALG